MTIPGVGVTTAATLIAAIGDVDRFPTAKELVGYLGLDPRVRQSGARPPDKAGSPNKAPPPAGTSSSKPPGRRSKPPGRCARSTNAPEPAAARRSRSSPPPANSPPCAGSCSPPPGLRLQTPDRDRPQTPRARTPGRRPDPPRLQRQPGTPTVKQRAQIEKQLTEQAELAYQRLIQDWTATGKRHLSPSQPLTFMRRSLRERVVCSRLWNNALMPLGSGRSRRRSGAPSGQRCRHPASGEECATGRVRLVVSRISGSSLDRPTLVSGRRRPGRRRRRLWLTALGMLA